MNFVHPRRKKMRLGKKTWGANDLLSFFLPLLPAGNFAINRPVREKYVFKTEYINLNI